MVSIASKFKSISFEVYTHYAQNMVQKDKRNVVFCRKTYLTIVRRYRQCWTTRVSLEFWSYINRGCRGIFFCHIDVLWSKKCCASLIIVKEIIQLHLVFVHVPSQKVVFLRTVDMLQFNFKVEFFREFYSLSQSSFYLEANTMSIVQKHVPHE